jgi:hypothetical protein
VFQIVAGPRDPSSSVDKGRCVQGLDQNQSKGDEKPRKGASSKKQLS